MEWSLISNEILKKHDSFLHPDFFKYGFPLINVQSLLSRIETATSWYFLKLATDEEGERPCAGKQPAAAGLAALCSITQAGSGCGLWTTINLLEASGVM